MLALDERDVHLELRGTDGGDVATGSAADHDKVEMLLGHVDIPHPQSSIASGSSTIRLKAARNSAPTAPSTTR